MTSLDQALYLLLHDRRALDAFLSGDPPFELSPEDRDALGVTDGEQLRTAADALRVTLWQRAHRGAGTLLDAFPRTLGAWRSIHPHDPELRLLADAFLASSAYAAYREVPYAGQGLCLEDAFTRFCRDSAIGDTAVCQAECHAAVVRTLALTHDPEFVLPHGVRAVPAGWCAVAAGPPPVLHAALHGRYVTGPLTPLLADLLAQPDPYAIAADHYGADAATVRASLTALAELGLVRPPVPVGYSM